MAVVAIMNQVRSLTQYCLFSQSRIKEKRVSWDLRGIPESIETVQKAERMGVKNQNTPRRCDPRPFLKI